MSEAEQKKLYKVFVGNVPYLCTTEEFVECFQQMEGFVEADIVRRPNSKFSRGFGFVTFDQQSALDQILARDDLELNGRILRFSAYEYDREPKNYLVFLRGVPEEYNEDRLKETMDRFGEVKEVTLHLNRETNKPTGTAVVGYGSVDTMREVLRERECTVEEGVLLRFFPYRKHPTNRRQRLYKTARDAYMAGFQAGNMSTSGSHLVDRVKEE